MSRTAAIVFIPLFLSTAADCTLQHQRIKDLLINTERSCTGTVLVVDNEFPADQFEFIDELILQHRIPIVMFESSNIATQTFRQRNDPREANICHQLIAFCSHAEECRRIYEQAAKVYFLNQVALVVDNSCAKAKYILNDIQQEIVILMSLAESEGYQWRVDDRVHRIDLSSIFNMSQLLTRPHGNLMGRKLRVATLHFPPAVFVGDNGTIHGIEAHLVHLLADRLNFTIDYVLASREEMWGVPQSFQDGKPILSGLRGMLQRREVDVAFGDLHVIDEWKEFFSFGNSFHTNYECFLVPSPKPYAKWKALIYPFSLPTWIAMLVSVAFATLTLLWMAKWSTSSADSRFQQGLAAGLYIIGSLLAVSQPRGNPSIPTRVFIMAWISAATITSTIYLSGLISFMTHPFHPPPIQTVQQLVKSPINKTIYHELYKVLLMNSSDPHRRLLGHQLVPSDNLTHMFNLIGSDQWAVDSNLDHLLYEIEMRFPAGGHQDRPFHLMKECLFPTCSSFGMQKNSPLKPYLDREMIRFSESGLSRYHRSKYVKELKDIKQTASRAAVAFSLYNLQGAFYLLASGVSVSLLAFTCELLSGHLFKNRKELRTFQTKA